MAAIGWGTAAASIVRLFIAEQGLPSVWQSWLVLSDRGLQPLWQLACVCP